jgi:phage baseplate assembly protein W
MNVPRYRAFQFLHPDLDAPEAFAGLNLSPTGGMAMVEGDDSVRQAIFLLLSTSPGERVMRPAYGCDLRKLLFSPNDDTTAGLAIHYVRQALDRWEPRIEVLRLDAGRNEADPSCLSIELEYRVRATRQADQLSLSVNLAGG